MFRQPLPYGSFPCIATSAQTLFLEAQTGATTRVQSRWVAPFEMRLRCDGWSVWPALYLNLRVNKNELIHGSPVFRMALDNYRGCFGRTAKQTGSSF